MGQGVTYRFEIRVQANVVCVSTNLNVATRLVESSSVLEQHDWASVTLNIPGSQLDWGLV